MQAEIIPAEIGDLPMVENLARFYIYDMSEFMGWPCPASGLYGGCDEFFDDWRAGANEPLLLRIGGEIAGFAGVKQIDIDGQAGHCIQEFFVIRKFRRRGVGREVAVELFRQHPGPWKAEQLAGNTLAERFWRAVITDHTGDQFTELTRPSQWGDMNVITFVSA